MTRSAWLQSADAGGRWSGIAARLLAEHGETREAKSANKLACLLLSEERERPAGVLAPARPRKWAKRPYTSTERQGVGRAMVRLVDHGLVVRNLGSWSIPHEVTRAAERAAVNADAEDALACMRPTVRALTGGAGAGLPAPVTRGDVDDRAWAPNGQLVARQGEVQRRVREVFGPRAEGKLQRELGRADTKSARLLALASQVEEALWETGLEALVADKEPTAFVPYFAAILERLQTSVEENCREEQPPRLNCPERSALVAARTARQAADDRARKAIGWTRGIWGWLPPGQSVRRAWGVVSTTEPPLGKTRDAGGLHKQRGVVREASDGSTASTRARVGVYRTCSRQICVR